MGKGVRNSGRYSEMRNIHMSSLLNKLGSLRVLSVGWIALWISTNSSWEKKRLTCQNVRRGIEEMLNPFRRVRVHKRGEVDER